MQVTVFDFETTGLSVEHDIPVSFAYLTLDSTLTKFYESGLLYFYDSEKKSSEDAYAVHGIPDSFLETEKDNLPHNRRKLFQILSRGVLIGHNAKAFDYPLGVNYLLRAGYVEPAPATVIDTLSVFKPVTKSGHRKLKDIIDTMGVSPEILDFMCKTWFPDQANAQFHNAAYDVTATALIAKFALRNKLMPAIGG